MLVALPQQHRPWAFCPLPFEQEQKDSAIYKSAEAHFKLGRIYKLKLKEPTNALETYNKHLTKFPDNKRHTEVMYAIYLMYRELEEPEKEKEVVNEVKIAEKESAGAIMEYLLPKEVEEYNEDIISQVSKQLSEMQVATEADKDKIKNLKSIDSLEKLKTEFLSFKDIVAKQMSFAGGGLDPNKISADLVPTTANTFSLGSANRPWKDLHLSGSSLIIGGTTMDSAELTVLDNVTTGTVSASKAVIVDSSKDITGFRNVTATGTSTFGSLSDGSITITAFVDEDNMASNSATLVPTQQSVKAYVDSSSGVLNFSADDENSLDIQLASETMLFAGGTGMETSSSGNTITVSIDSSVATKNFSIAQAIALG